MMINSEEISRKLIELAADVLGDSFDLVEDRLKGKLLDRITDLERERDDLQEQNEELQKLNKELRCETTLKWVDAKKKKPIGDGCVLVAKRLKNGNISTEVARYDNGVDNDYFSWYCHGSDRIVAWCELPELPEEV